MSHLTSAFTDEEDPYWACYYGVTTHPKYGECQDCPSYVICDAPHKKNKPVKHEPPADCPGGCFGCPKPFLGECHFWD